MRIARHQKVGQDVCQHTGRPRDLVRNGAEECFDFSVMGFWLTPNVAERKVSVFWAR
jgi:hypothetical protein